MYQIYLWKKKFSTAAETCTVVHVCIYIYTHIPFSIRLLHQYLLLDRSDYLIDWYLIAYMYLANILLIGLWSCLWEIAQKGNYHPCQLPYFIKILVHQSETFSVLENLLLYQAVHAKVCGWSCISPGHCPISSHHNVDRHHTSETS